MMPATLLQHLQSLGITLRPEGEILHVAPPRLITKELAAQIRTHKTALLALLRPPEVQDGPQHYYSQVLEEEFWLCATEAEVDALRAEGAVGYLPGEIAHLKRMRQDDPEGFPAKLKAVHQSKQVFDGAVVRREKLVLVPEEVRPTDHEVDVHGA